MRGAAVPCTQITWAYFLGSEEPLLELLCLAKFHHTTSSPIPNCQCSKSAIFFVQYKFIVVVTCRNTYYMYIEHNIPEVEMKMIAASSNNVYIIVSIVFEQYKSIV